MPSVPDQPVILFHYEGSIYAKRVLWALALKGIPYMQCLQPMVIPRPDLQRLGINYRRIPVVSMGRDVYLDTRLIIRKLDQFSPQDERLCTSTNTEHKAIQKLLEALTMDGGLPQRAVQLLPSDMPLFADAAFVKDRADFNGGSMAISAEAVSAARPDAINEFRDFFELLETTLLADGRQWILNTTEPSLADIEAVWPLHFVTSVPGALPQEHINPQRYPKVFSWIDRFNAAITQAQEALPQPQVISGDVAAALIAEAQYNEPEGRFDVNDPVVQREGIKRGQLIQLWPTDTGCAHKDLGRIVSISRKEVAIETVTGDVSVRVHAPRHGFGLSAYRQQDRWTKPRQRRIPGRGNGQLMQISAKL